MIRPLRCVAGALAFGLLLVWLALVAMPSLSFGVALAARIWPHRRLQLVSAWARIVCRVVLAFLRLGLADFVLNVHRIDGRTELVGRYDPPALAEDLPAFVARLHADLGAHLASMRARRSSGPSSTVNRAAAMATTSDGERVLVTGA